MNTVRVVHCKNEHPDRNFTLGCAESILDQVRKTIDLTNSIDQLDLRAKYSGSVI